MNCGARLPEQAEPVTEESASAVDGSVEQGSVVATGAPVQKEASGTCPSCWHVNPAGAPYCEVCGAPLSMEQRDVFTGMRTQSNAAESWLRDEASAPTVEPRYPVSGGSHFATASNGQGTAPQATGSQRREQHPQPVSDQPQPAQQQDQTVYGPPASWDADDGGNRKADHTKAVLSLVLGIVGVVIYWPSFFLLYVLSAPSKVALLAGSIVGAVLGIVGLVLSSMAKKAGNREGIRTAGFVLSLIAIILNVVYFATCEISVAAIMASY